MQRLKPLIAVLGLVAGAASAQPPGPPPGGQLDIERLTVLLDLDAYQKGQVERALTEQREVVRAAREERAAASEPPSRDDMRARREQDREALVGRLQDTLTVQQLTKLKLLMEPPQGGRGPLGGRF